MISCKDMKLICILFYRITAKPISGFNKIQEEENVSYDKLVELRQIAAKEVGIEIVPLVRT